MPQTLTHNDRFAPGDQVELRGSHSWKGERGQIIARPGAFYGFAVRLDHGIVLGAGERQMWMTADA